MNIRTCDRARWAILFVLLLAAGVGAATSVIDGPYVLKDAKGGWTTKWVAANEVKTRAVEVGEQVEIPAVGRLPAFSVRLRPPAALAPNTVSVPDTTPIFVVADTHGEFEILVELLQKQHIVDDDLHWAFGRGQLVFLGDVFDRGPHQTEILWLIYRLEGEAAEAGGRVHLLLGNHEAMALGGDERYLHPKYLQAAQALGVAAYGELVGPRTLLGQWLRSKPAVLRLDDLLLMHGGISPEVVERGLTLAQLNQAVRDTLNDALPAAEDRARSEFVMGRTGPLWYRGYFARAAGPAVATGEDIDRIRRHFGVRTLLVGHTPVPTVTPLYEGRVIAVQVYPHRDEATGKAVMEAVLRKEGTWYRAGVDGTREPLAGMRPECPPPG